MEKIMNENEMQVLMDRLARRLATARLALDIPTTPCVVDFHLAFVTDIAAQVRALPAATALPAVRGAFGSATEALLAEVLTMKSVPDTIPNQWTREAGCPACGQVPDALARCRCS
jgi:hypothetical protein